MTNFRLVNGLVPNMGTTEIKGATMGADQLAQSILYFTLFYHRYYMVGLGFMAWDFMYYGPQTMGGPLSAFIAGLTLL